MGWVASQTISPGKPVRMRTVSARVFMEISSLASYVLVAGGPDRRALPAVFKYLLMGTIGATFYLIGVGSPTDMPEEVQTAFDRIFARPGKRGVSN